MKKDILQGRMFFPFI